MTKNITKLALKSIAFAMGVVVIVMSSRGTFRALSFGARSSKTAMAGCPSQSG